MIDAQPHATTTAFKTRQATKMVCDGVIVVMSSVIEIFANEIATISKIWPT